MSPTERSAAEQPEHYFADDPGTVSQRREVVLHLPDGQLVLSTDRGVFSADEVDVGTRYLLLDAPMPPVDHPVTVADVGCGYGPIALTLARRCPQARVLAVDVNRRARELCRDNAARAALQNVEVAGPDEVDPAQRLDAIYANPPIRIGKVALHDLLTGWLERLHPDGYAVLVVHKHLGSDSLQAWLEQRGYRTVRLGSRLGYRLLEVRPRPAEEPLS